MAAHSRTYSASPGNYPPRTYSPSTSSLHQQQQWSGSLRDTAYDGSEGYIGDSSHQVVLAPPPRPASPPKALGARFLSSLSNAQPAAAALTRKGSVLHSRAKSLAGFVPKLNTSSPSAPSEKAEKAHVPNKIFGDLFHGESAPIRIGAPVSPTKEKEESEFIMDYNTGFTERPSSMFRRRDTGLSTKTAASAPQKTSWFGRRATSTSIPKHSSDELATLSINASLFPNGPADPLNPAAFNDLLLNATNLLNRMQAAYKEKVDYISNIQPEIDAQKEEVEEADTRTKHLKMQLEHLARQASEQETAMQDMARQLTEEKIKAHEAIEAARTIRLVTRPENRDSDEEQTPRRRKRNSGGSASDSGFESDLDSVFSAGTASGAETPMTAQSVFSAGHAREIRVGPKRIDSVVSRAGNQKKSGAEHAAWATVESLRNENQDLRREMEEMQKTLQGCIDLVSGVPSV